MEDKTKRQQLYMKPIVQSRSHNTLLNLIQGQSKSVVIVEQQIMETEVTAKDVRKRDKMRLSMSQLQSVEKPISNAKRSTLTDVIANINAVSDRDKFRAA